MKARVLFSYLSLLDHLLVLLPRLGLSPLLFQEIASLINQDLTPSHLSRPPYLQIITLTIWQLSPVVF